MKPVGAYGRTAQLMRPALDGAQWRVCGHPKTPENTQHIGKAGVRCRICRRAIANKCGSKIRRAA